MLRRNVMIFHQGALGDFLVTWPLAAGLGRAFAQSRIAYVTAGQKGKLAEEILRLESIDVEAGWHGLFAAAAPRLPEAAAKWLAGAQLILSFVSNGADDWARNVKQLAPQATLLFIQVDRQHPLAVSATVTAMVPALAGHVTLEILQQLSPNPIAQMAMAQMLTALQSRPITPRPAAGHTILIHPGAGHPGKCWPLAKFVELIAALKPRPVEIVMGETERDRWPAADFARLQALAPVHQPATLSDLALLLRPAAAFIGHDSGPAHLAGLLGVPTLALFGTDATRWWPLGPNVKTLTAEPIDSIEVNDVVAALDALSRYFGGGLGGG